MKFFLRYAEKFFAQIYRDAKLVAMPMGTNIAAGNQQKHLSPCFTN